MNRPAVHLALNCKCGQGISIAQAFMG